MSPALPAFFTIIQEYMAGRLSVEEAAPKLVAALDGVSASVNLPVSPKMRPLLREVYRLKNGQEPPSGPPFVPDAKRHQRGNLELLANTVDSFWKSLRELRKPASLSCSYHAATEPIARRIGEWLETHGQAVTIESPLEADEDDWLVQGRTPTKTWTRELVIEWVAVLKAAPLAGSASVMGIAVVDG